MALILWAMRASLRTRPAPCGCTCARRRPSGGPRRGCGRRASRHRRPCRPGRPRWRPGRASDSGVVIDTASTSLDSKTLRMSSNSVGARAAQLSDQRDGALAGRLVDVADGHDAALRVEGRIVVDVVRASSAEADLTDIDPVVGPEDGEAGGGNGGGRGFQERASSERHGGAIVTLCGAGVELCLRRFAYGLRRLIHEAVESY